MCFMSGCKKNFLGTIKFTFVSNQCPIGLHNIAKKPTECFSNSGFYHGNTGLEAEIYPK